MKDEGGVKGVIARLILSLVGGVILFLAVSIVGGILSTYTENRTLQVLLEMPSRWPRYLYYYLSPTPSKPSLYFDDAASLVTLIVCNIVLYSLITFFALWSLWDLRRREIKYDPPPPPATQL